MSNKKNRRPHNPAEKRMAQLIDDVSVFEEFKNDILPELRKMLKAGASAEEIYTFAQSYTAARTVTIALTEEDSGKALTAIKDVLDRTQGKAKERVEHEHRYGKLPDNELDALIESRLSEVDSEHTDEPH